MSRNRGSRARCVSRAHEERLSIDDPPEHGEAFHGRDQITPDLVAELASLSDDLVTAGS